MAWLVQDGESLMKKVANDNNAELSMSGKVNAKLSEIMKANPEKAGAFSALKDDFKVETTANDNNFFSTSGTVEVSSSTSRLDALREALAKHNNTEAVQAPESSEEFPRTVAEQVQESEHEVIGSVVDEKQTKFKPAYNVQYPVPTGLDLSRLPNIPEAKSIETFSEAYKLETAMKQKVGELKGFNVDAKKVINYINSQNFTGLSGEYFDRVVAASNKKIEESIAKARDIVNTKTAEIENLTQGIKPVNPQITRCLGVLDNSRGTSFGLPKTIANVLLERGNGEDLANTLVVNGSTGISFIRALSARKMEVGNDNNGASAKAA